MKAFLPLLLSFFFIISCQQHKEATISPIDEEDELQEEADSLPRATAIFWLDKYHMKELKKDDVLTFRTAKAKVIIRNDGTIELLSFVEQQPGNAQRYIRYRLKDFKVKKILMDNGYINPGEQYVQLRKDGFVIESEPRTTGDGYFESAILDPEGNIVEITI